MLIKWGRGNLFPRHQAFYFTSPNTGNTITLSRDDEVKFPRENRRDGKSNRGDVKMARLNRGDVKTEMNNTDANAVRQNRITVMSNQIGMTRLVRFFEFVPAREEGARSSE